jgi:hypothetical protein
MKDEVKRMSNSIAFVLHLAAFILQKGDAAIADRVA